MSEKTVATCVYVGWFEYMDFFELQLYMVIPLITHTHTHT